MEPKQLRVKANCTNKSCPLFVGCAQYPTIIVTYTGKPDNIVCSFINENHSDCSTLIDKIMPAIFKKIGSTFNYTITNDIRAVTDTLFYFKASDCCLKLIRRDLVALKTKFIVTLGRNANDSLNKYGIGISINSFHGSDQISDVKDIPMTLTYPLSIIESKPEFIKTIALDILSGYKMFIQGEVK